jgi:hypothetical protein
MTLPSPIGVTPPAKARRGGRVTGAVESGARITTGNALYVASQFMPALAGAVLVTLVVAQALLSAFSSRRQRLAMSGSAAHLHGRRTVLIVAACMTIFLLQVALLPHELKLFTAAHLLVYLVVALGARSLKPSWPSLGLVKISVWANALLLLTYYMPGLKEQFWYENLGQYRFRSIYFEPSIAALMFVLNILVLWSNTAKVRYAALLVALSLVSLALTYSGSGLLVLAALALTGFSRKHLWLLVKLVLVTGPVLALWALSPGGSEAFQEMIVSRIAGILALEFDASVFLRAVAPFLFLLDLVDSPWTFLLGAGIGGIESFILSNESTFWYLTNFSGEQLTAINNGYIVTAALLGIPMALLLGLVMATWLWRSRAPRGLKMFLLLYPFVSGFVIHPLLWLLVVMVGVQSAPAPERSVVRHVRHKRHNPK